MSAAERQTQAVVISEPGNVALQQVALKQPEPTDVVIRTVYTSISAGTERMLLAGQMPHPMLSLPVVPGYETVGRIVAIGTEVDPVWQDRLVYVGGALCYDGVNAAWGGQAAELFADVSRVIPLDGVELQQGVLLALAATALHGIDRAAPAAGERLLVLGQGPVGQLAARIARQRGVWVAVADRTPSRLARAVADQVINVEETPVTEALTEPVTTIVEATGSMAALTAALPQLAQGGTILLLGYYNKLDLPYMPLFLKEAQLLTAKEWAPGDLLRCRDMLADGSLAVAPLITHCAPITEVTQAYKTALDDPDCLKLVLDWSALQ
ncbi:MAG: zinc-binding dehydrogenase [Caldilineaceae bacterium]|nr:zinc-binding dehydrogenase [Caldilineaceae bacterium]